MSWKNGTRLLRRTDVKMTVWYVFTFLVSVGIIGVFLYVGLERQLLKEVDRFILDETNELGKILRKASADPTLFQEFENEAAARRYYPFFFQILNDQGKLIYRSKGFDGIQYPPFEKVVHNARIGKRTREDISFSGQKRLLRVVSTPLIEKSQLIYIIQFGTHLYFVRKSLSNFKNSLMAALPIVLILGALGGWVLARRSLSPIGYIVSKTQSITSENLNERLASRGTGDEMDDLIQTINEMIGRLESSFKRLAEFTADTSHELRTPLCAMRGEAEVLLSKPRTPEEYQEALVHFIEGFDRLNQLSNDLILLSKFDATQMEITKTPLRLDLLLKDLGDLFQVLAEQKGLTFEVNVREEAILVGDKIRLQQLFTNLIDNAIKYTSKGSIRIALETDGKTIRVHVKDTGVGISKEEQDKIFKRFYRVDKSRSRETGGVGLGLSISEWIVQAHHGTIEVQSEANQGSTFTVSFPLQDASLNRPR
ncbi:MAG TPA: heavy metal sensor histidine kinase [Thermodesulfobacteriota bacterium]|nr:heavy metal sensor histidine kinase [Thermodesulfobacteriota bacterium]